MLHRTPRLALAGAAWLCGAACSRTVSLDAGPPPRPLFHDVEGLRWGMTPDEVRSVWGPGQEGKAYSYENKSGYSSIGLGYMSIPADMVVHKDVKRSGNGPTELLIWVGYSGDATITKEKVRGDLVSRFGQPLSAPALAESLSCQAPRCEAWRAAECTVVTAAWAPANAEANWPEHVSSLTWHLAPAGLVTWVPRSEWARIRGQVSLAYTAEAEETIRAFRWGVDGTGAAAIAKVLGPPNLQLEEKPGQTELVYLFLDDTVQKLRMVDGKLQGLSGQSRNP